MSNENPWSQKIACMLWFENQAEKAVEYYIELFPNSKIGFKTYQSSKDYQHIHNHEKELLTIEFWLDGFHFIALNGGPKYSVNPSVSFYAAYENEFFIDEIWAKLADQGTVLLPFENHELSSKYGKLIDRFDVTWHFALAERKDIREDRITPYLTFINQQHGKASEAVDYYVSIFKNAARNESIYYTENDSPEISGNARNIHFTLENQHFMAMDSSIFHLYDFCEAVSFIIFCDNQEEIDYYQDKLCEGGEAQTGGWLKDRYGLSWQVIPKMFFEILYLQNPVLSQEILKAVMNMKKFSLTELTRIKNLYIK